MKKADIISLVRMVRISVFCTFSLMSVFASAHPALDQFLGKPKAQMPELVYAGEVSNFKIYFTGQSRECDESTDRQNKPNWFKMAEADASYIVAQNLATQFSGFVERLTKNEPVSGKLLSKTFYPVNIVISLIDETVDGAAGLNQTLSICSDIDDDKLPVGRKDIRIIYMGAKGQTTQTQQMESSLNILTHEAGHLLLRALDYPKWFFYEEAFADLIALSINNWSPYIGEGITIPINNEKYSLEKYWDLIRQVLASKETKPRERALLEAQLAVGSNKALRDFTKTPPYLDLFLAPESHQVSSYLNPAIYRLGLKSSPENISQQFFKALLNRSDAMMQVDPLITYSAIFDGSSVELKQNGWQSPSLSSATLVAKVAFSEKIENGDEPRGESDYTYNVDEKRKAGMLQIGASAKLIKERSAAPISPLIFSLHVNKKTTFTGLADIAKGSDRAIAYIPVVKCFPKDQNCFCAETPEVAVDVYGIFLNKESGLSSVAAKVRLPKGTRGCYQFVESDSGYSFE